VLQRGLKLQLLKPLIEDSEPETYFLLERLVGFLQFHPAISFWVFNVIKKDLTDLMVIRKLGFSNILFSKAVGQHGVLCPQFDNILLHRSTGFLSKSSKQSKALH